MELFRIADDIEDQAVLLNQARVILGEALKYFERPIKAGSEEAKTLIRKANGIYELLVVIDDHMFKAISTLDKVADALPKSKQDMKEPEKHNEIHYLKEAKNAIEKGLETLRGYILDCEETGHLGEWLHVQGGVVTCTDLAYELMNTYTRKLRNQEAATDAKQVSYVLRCKPTDDIPAIKKQWEEICKEAGITGSVIVEPVEEPPKE